jgi:hypothetical protein
MFRNQESRMNCDYCGSLIAEDYVDLTFRKKDEYMGWFESHDRYFCDTACCFNFLEEKCDLTKQKESK